MTYISILQTSLKTPKSTFEINNLRRNSNLQMSLEARGPILGNESIEHNKLNKFCSTYLYKRFTSKKKIYQCQQKFDSTGEP